MFDKLPDNALYNLKRMHAYRHRKRIHLSFIAQKLNIDTSTLSAYEKGLKTPDVFDYYKLSSFFSWCDYFAISFSFINGHVYNIPKIGLNAKDDTVFYYIGKRGIHHIFQSVSGGWKISFSDRQLIGRTITEVTQ